MAKKHNEIPSVQSAVEPIHPDLNVKLEKILTTLETLVPRDKAAKAEWDRLNEENRRLTGQATKLEGQLTEAKMGEKITLQKRLKEAEIVFRAIATMQERLQGQSWTRDWWIGLEAIKRAEKALEEIWGYEPRDFPVRKISKVG